MHVRDSSKTKRLVSWGMYDFANSAYVLIFNSYLFPLYFRSKVFPNEEGPFLWGLAVSLSVILAVLVAPIVGYLADRWNRKLLFGSSIILAFGGMSCISLLPPTNSIAILITFLITNCAFIITLSVYDSFLPHLSSSKERDEFSGFGWGFGYLGGVLCFIGVFLIQKNTGDFSRLALGFTAVFFLFFSFLSFRLIPSTITKINKSIKAISKEYLGKTILGLLIAFWLINDVIAVVIFFTAIFATETIGLSVQVVGGILLGVQILAFPATWGAGVLARKSGQLRVVLWSIALWALIILGLTFASTTLHVIFIAFLTSLVIGTTQALMRSIYSDLLPESISGFSFGLYAIASKSSAIIGPPVFGAIAVLSGSQRIAMAVMIIPLLVGAAILTKSMMTIPRVKPE